MSYVNTFFSDDPESGLEPRIVVDNNVPYDDEESRKLMEKRSNFETGVSGKFVGNNSQGQRDDFTDQPKTSSNLKDENIASSGMEYVPAKKIDHETEGYIINNILITF